MVEQKRRVPLAVIFGRVLTVLLIVLVLLRLFPFFYRGGIDENALYVYVLDVGQGDAVLLRMGEATMLIDTASASKEDALRTALLQYDVKRLDYLVLTHPHEDHIGNARSVLEWLEVGEVLLPAVDSEESLYRIFCAVAKTESQVRSVQTGDRFSLGKATVKVLLAGGVVGESADADQNVNNGGTVLRIELGEKALLFMGDAEAQAEEVLLAMYPLSELRCDFLRVGHHGSSTSSSAPFLAATSPSIAAISCGRDNTYGFPHKEVLEELVVVGAQIYRTDESGTLAFCTDGTKFSRVLEGALK